MTPEIQERIAQLRRGEVPEGYKKTKMHILPNDWNEQSIGKYIVEHNEKTTKPNQYPVLTSARTGLMLQTDYYANRQVTTDDNIGYNVLPRGYITFRSRSDDGKFKFNENTIIDKGIISYFYPVFSFKHSVCHSYMIQLLNETIYHELYPYIEGTAQQVLSLKKLGSLKFAIPNLIEQQRIATILTTQDKVIELKEKLLEQKKQQKKYLMQQLLTGKKRLPGFDEKWNKTNLAKISKKQNRKNKDFLVTEVFSNSAQLGIVPQEDQFDKDIANADRIDGYYIVEDGMFIYNPRISNSAPCGPIRQNKLGRTGVMSPLYTVFAVQSSVISVAFLDHYFQSTCWHKYMKSVANYGARHDRMAVSNEDFFAMPIPIPPMNEQIAIADVLSTADREINLLQQCIDAEKQKKKALMQLLLTGIVRVKA